MSEKAKCGCPLQRLGPDTQSVAHNENCTYARDLRRRRAAQKRKATRERKAQKASKKEGRC